MNTACLLSSLVSLPGMLILFLELLCQTCSLYPQCLLTLYIFHFFTFMCNNPENFLDYLQYFNSFFNCSQNSFESIHLMFCFYYYSFNYRSSMCFFFKSFLFSQFLLPISWSLFLSSYPKYLKYSFYSLHMIIYYQKGRGVRPATEFCSKFTFLLCFIKLDCKLIFIKALRILYSLD